METIVIELKDQEKRKFLLDLLAELDFVHVKSDAKPMEASNASSQAVSLFDSAGMWADRDIDGDSLRKAAWKR